MIGSVAVSTSLRGTVARRWRRFLTSAVISLVVGSVAACTVPISYYDATTYKNLTDLKAEAAILVASFDSILVSSNKRAMDQLILNFRKAYEYEKGKGRPNSDTMRQFNKIQQLILEDIADYRESGPGGLGPKYFNEAAIVLGQAFDIVIATENLKNRDKQ